MRRLIALLITLFAPAPPAIRHPERLVLSGSLKTR